VRVRAARGEDFERVAALLELAGRPPLDRATHDDAEAIYERQVHDPDAHHLVAEDDSGRVVGFCGLHFRRRLNHATEEAWVAELFVLENARHHGVGRALVEEAERRARGRDCHALVLESGYRDAEGHALYRDLRMRDIAKQFRRDLRK
jgi:GNAT superfamily N-acetyltransferase